ncbi:alpha/beta fold hydrolase [Actinosynnema sp. NPDC091369]
MISRRSFTRAVAVSAVATSLPAVTATTATATGNTSLGRIKHVRAGVLDIAYAEFGPRTGQAVVLLHGWPYDAHSYVDVAPLLAAEGYRVLVPFLRGYGGTTFLSPDAVRNGQQSAVALDVIAFMDALRIDQAVLGGFDWGARTVGVVAALWPRRCKAIVSVSGYLVTNLKRNLEPLPPAAERGWWYQYYFATERGVLGYRRDRHGFNKLIWREASPRWDFDDATVPAITIGSDFDGAAADGSSYRDKFTGRYDHRVFEGIGHNVPQEAPVPFARAVVDADHL